MHTKSKISLNYVEEGANNYRFYKAPKVIPNCVMPLEWYIATPTWSGVFKIVVEHISIFPPMPGINCVGNWLNSQCDILLCEVPQLSFCCKWTSMNKREHHMQGDYPTLQCICINYFVYYFILNRYKGINTHKQKNISTLHQLVKELEAFLTLIISRYSLF